MNYGTCRGGEIGVSACVCPGGYVVSQNVSFTLIPFISLAAGGELLLTILLIMPPILYKWRVVSNTGLVSTLVI